MRRELPRLGSLLALLIGLLASSAAQAQILTRNLIYNSVQPCRVFDTRSSTGGMLLAGVHRTFNIVGGNVTSTTFTGQGGTNGGCALPGFVGFPKVQAVVINLSVVGPAATGHIVAWPSDRPQPLAAAVNFTAGVNLANAIVLPVRQDTQGADITLASAANTHVIGDVMGYFSDDSTTSANSLGNVFLGQLAGLSVGTGRLNTGMGFAALADLTTGEFNVAMGSTALAQLTTGGVNVAIGREALGNLQSGDNNIGIGNGAGGTLFGPSTLSNTISIGSLGDGNSNSIRIGNQGLQTRTFIAGIHGATSSSGTAVFVNSSGQLGTIPSSLRFKEDVADMGEASQALMQLRPVTFYYKPQYDDGSRIQQYGLVAEEVAKVAPSLVQYDEEGQPLAVRYQLINAMLLNEVQSQHRQIGELEKQIEELKRQVEALKP